MKPSTIHTKADDILHRFPALGKRLASFRTTLAPEAPPPIISLGGDLEAAGVCVAAQVGLSEPLPLGTMARERLLELGQALRGFGWQCAVGVEACGFGWKFQRE